MVPAVTCRGVRGAFSSVSHWAASSGAASAREFSPGTTSRPAQTGQPQPDSRELTDACQECPFSQSHHAGLWLPAKTSDGFRGAFFRRSHWAASAGYREARSLPCPTRLPVQ